MHEANVCMCCSVLLHFDLKAMAVTEKIEYI